MLCQECEDRKAQVHVTKIINGDKRELYLCKKCAEEIDGLDFSNNFSFDNLLTGILNNKLNPEHQLKLSKSDIECEVCGLSYKEFSRNGRLGCDSCYESFRDRVKNVLRKIHSSTKHTGKFPQRAGTKIRTKREIEKLNREMDEAVEKEEFERAAELRDRIKELKNKLDNEEE